ncbi:hypothetical protein ACWCO6_35270, partial [Streptomyces sp. NPDC001809]
MPSHADEGRIGASGGGRRRRRRGAQPSRVPPGGTPSAGAARQGRGGRRRKASPSGRGGARGAESGRRGAHGVDGRPLSRVEARRAARAAKDSVGVVASRAVGELFITFGVVMLLFVAYQLWWT